MEVQKITDNGVVLAVIVKQGAVWDKGLNFISDDGDYAQVGFWNYDKGKILQAHVHLEAPRQVLKTQEVIVVRQGSMRADIFTQEEKLCASVNMEAGDIGIFLQGGHGYEILQDNTLVLEVKNGPYVGPESDRKRI